jgi:hypothetical protein
VVAAAATAAVAAEDVAMVVAAAAVAAGNRISNFNRKAPGESQALFSWWESRKLS